MSDTQVQIQKLEQELAMMKGQRELELQAAAKQRIKDRLEGRCFIERRDTPYGQLFTCRRYGRVRFGTSDDLPWFSCDVLCGCIRLPGAYGSGFFVRVDDCKEVSYGLNGFELPTEEIPQSTCDAIIAVLKGYVFEADKVVTDMLKGVENVS